MSADVSPKMRLVYLYAIHLDASVRTYPCAGAAACAVLGVSHIRIVIATVVDLIGLQGQSVGGTSHYTEVASLASVDVDGNCALYFCHI